MILIQTSGIHCLYIEGASAVDPLSISKVISSHLPPTKAVISVFSSS